MTKSAEIAPEINVGSLERAASALGGSALVFAGLRNGSLKGLLFAALGGAALYRGLTGHCDLYQNFGINTADLEKKQQGVKIDKSILIHAPREQLFKFWRRLENLPMIMSHLNSVERLDSKRSRWTATGPLDQKITWEAVIVNEVENEVLAWESVDGSMIQTAGSVRFEDAGNNESLVRVNFQFTPPAGELGAAVAKLLGDDPAEQVMSDLERFKEAMEVSEAAPAA
jgi:uncharacterized membrane protein